MGMILAVCLNPALDLTYHVAELAPGTPHRVQSVQERAGGKACNTARVLAQLSVEVALCGFAGGARGARLRAALAGSDVKDRLIAVDGETRQSVAVVHGSDVTVLNEPGPRISSAEWQALLAEVEGVLPDARAVVLSGSVPTGVPDDAYAQLVGLARSHDVPSVLDTGGAQLLAALPERPTIAAPNHHEAAKALGAPLSHPEEVLDAASSLSARSRAAVVVSMGSEGLVAAEVARRWRVRPPRVLPGNPTGAGDALTAALAWGMAEMRRLPDTLADAVCLAGAAVVQPIAGEVDPATYRELCEICEVEEVR
jgi:tagatose 6-phosphate kinase